MRAIGSIFGILLGFAASTAVVAAFLVGVAMAFASVFVGDPLSIFAML